MALLQAMRHHIRRGTMAATDKWDPDCDAEMEGEDQALERRIERIEKRLDQLTKITGELTIILQDMSKIARGEKL